LLLWKDGIVSDRWIINPEVDMVAVLAEYGRFLENDYRMMIEHLYIPKVFEEYTEKSGRKFVIVGARSVPTATAKSVFLCLKLAGPESIIVKAPTLDEAYLIQNVFDYYGEGVYTKVFIEPSEELVLNPEWRTGLEEATDIVVFGGQETIDSFAHYDHEQRRVWEHGPKLSFGIIRAEDLTPSNIANMCFDFFSFYGEGCLSPKFYIIVGDINSKQQYKEINDCMLAEFSTAIDEFRSKLPLTQKSALVQQMISLNKPYKYIQVEELNSDNIFTTLYGDARFCRVDDLDQVSDFINKWRDNISTVAVLDEDLELLDLLEDEMVTRICPIGSMQFPSFFEQFDTTDDFDIYVGEFNDYE
jgi:hypothetical protein